MNAIRVIHPYWHEGQLCFDDEKAGLVREPFVAGADWVLHLLSSRVEGCGQEFTLLFSDQEFPGAQTRVDWVRDEYGGATYVCEEFGENGWLCPALLKYFVVPPKKIWLQIKKKGA